MGINQEHEVFWTEAIRYFKTTCKDFGVNTNTFDRGHLTKSIDKSVFNCSAEWSIVAGIDGKKKPAVRVELVFKGSNPNT